MPRIREKLVASVARRYPLISGCGTFANSDWVRALSGPAGGSAWAPVDGGEVPADLDEYIGRSAYFVGDLDRKVTRLCQKRLRSGDTALDIGANIGMVSPAMRHGDRDGVDVVSVAVQRLDAVLDPRELGPVRLIKIDVEGFEAEVPAGAGDWLTQRKADAILFELNDRKSERLRDEPVIAALERLNALRDNLNLAH